MSYSEMTSDAYKSHDRVDTMWIVPKHLTEMDIPADFSTKDLIGEKSLEILKEQEKEEETGDSENEKEYVDGIVRTVHMNDESVSVTHDDPQLHIFVKNPTEYCSFMLTPDTARQMADKIIEAYDNLVQKNNNLSGLADIITELQKCREEVLRKKRTDI